VSVAQWEPSVDHCTVLRLTLRQGVQPLTSVLSVLHARRAPVGELTYSAGGGPASLVVRVDVDLSQAELLARQLDRRVDVLSVVAGRGRSSSAAVDRLASDRMAR
jgi:hypothetical protein